MFEPVRLTPADGLAAIPFELNAAYEASSQLKPAALNEVEIEAGVEAVFPAEIVAYKLKVTL